MDAKGIAKSNSTASAGGRSTKSYDSIKVIGGYMVGTLHLVRPDDSPRRSSPDSDQDDGPPPLDPPRISQPMLSRNPMAHTMGGGDVVIVLHLPEAYIVGYDCLSFTAKHFSGIRDLPSGPHFFWASHPHAASARCGFWIMSSGVNRVHVVQWDSYNEVFVQPTRAEARIQAEGADSIYHKLPPYRDPSAAGTAHGHLQAHKVDANLHTWKQLTGSITKTALDRITADEGGGWSVHTSDRVRGSLSRPTDMALHTGLSHPVFQSHELNFSLEQQTRTYSMTRIGRDRTLDASDPTSYILSWLDAPPGKRLSQEDIVGQLQFAYVVGVYLGNDACMQQWWYMTLRLFLRAHGLIVRLPTLAAALIRTLAAQLSHSISWLDDSIILDYSEVNCRDLHVALVVYKRRLDEIIQGRSWETAPGHAILGDSFARLQTVIAELGWDLGTSCAHDGQATMEDGEVAELELEELKAEDERGEWAPEIVELDEGGRQLGLLSWTD